MGTGKPDLTENFSSEFSVAADSFRRIDEHLTTSIMVRSHSYVSMIFRFVWSRIRSSVGSGEARANILGVQLPCGCIRMRYG